MIVYKFMDEFALYKQCKFINLNLHNTLETCIEKKKLMST